MAVLQLARRFSRKTFKPRGPFLAPIQPIQPIQQPAAKPIIPDVPSALLPKKPRKALRWAYPYTWKWGLSDASHREMTFVRAFCARNDIECNAYFQDWGHQLVLDMKGPAEAIHRLMDWHIEELKPKTWK